MFLDLALIVRIGEKKMFANRYSVQSCILVEPYSVPLDSRISIEDYNLLSNQLKIDE